MIILFFADIFPTHRMFQKHPMSFGRASAVCSRCISSNKGFFPDIGCLADIRCLTKMNSVWGNEIGFGIIISCRGRIIFRPLFLPVRTFTLCYVGSTDHSPLQFPRHRMFQKHPMSFGKASAVCSRCISSNKGFSRHRMSGRHPMSNCNEFRLGKRNRFWDYNISYGANDYSLLQLIFRNF